MNEKLDEDHIIAEFEINLNAKIVHTAKSDDIYITVDGKGRTTKEGLRKLILEIIDKTINYYQKFK